MKLGKGEEKGGDLFFFLFIHSLSSKSLPRVYK